MQRGSRDNEEDKSALSPEQEKELKTRANAIFKNIF